jgi:hypothetical protein
MEEVPWWFSLIIAWLPFLLMVWSVVWFGRQIARELRTQDGRALATVVDEYGRELKRSNDMLDQFLVDYRKRLETLERRG